ncbi:MAG: prepilin-type N-terminal cleavage/methylation domain-containing protein [Burkholderiales bacterium]|nr:prepilin-type N-terminal cleavage/methylation domain-containing protein [Burkholderiales bacterium]
MRGGRGFTLIELLVVLAAVALLLGIAVPRYVEHVDRARETVLRQSLAGMRQAIDAFYADRGRYPSELTELARERYLRELPRDPITERDDTWHIVAPPDNLAGKVFDVRSGAVGNGRDGRPYATW